MWSEKDAAENFFRDVLACFFKAGLVERRKGSLRNGIVEVNELVIFLYLFYR